VALGTWLFSGAADAPPDRQEELRRSAAFTAAGPLQLEAVPAAEIASAVAGLDGPGWTSERKAALQQEAEARRTPIVRLTLWDTEAEDGDVVHVESPGYPNVSVALKHARTTVALPAPASGVLTVRGDIDGGGGITMGVLSGGNPLDLPYLQPGQAVDVPVKPTW
jgi:hypothetical protein